MKNVKTLTATILIGMGLLMGGCGSNQQTTQPTQTQTVQQTEGISLAKAVDLAQKGQFTPQKVKFEGYTTSKIFGDEPYIVVTSRLEIGTEHKYVKIHVTDADVIKRVAKLQEEKQNKYINGTGTVDAHEITFNKYGEIVVK